MVENNLMITRPDLCKEWNYNKNYPLRPEDVTLGSNKKVWWLLPYDDPRTGKHFDFEWQARIQSRVKGANCPYLCNKAVYIGFNDLATLHKDITKEWNYKRNYPLRPEDVTDGSSKEVWWLLPYDDPRTGKHFDFEWKARINHRVKGIGCPYLSNQAIDRNYNSLAIVNPDLLKEWCTEKNRDLDPYTFSPYSHKKVFWKCKKGHIWYTSISKRMLGCNCPICSNQKVLEGYNDLASHPQYGYLAKEWHPTKNGDLKPTMVTPFTSKKVYWLCPNGHIYQASIQSRTSKGSGCILCLGSNMEKFTYHILEKWNINYKKEYSFKNDTEIGNFRYDIYLEKYNMIIELDGEQHFKTSNTSCFNKKITVKERTERDNLKNKFALENKIPILRIPYVYLPGRDKEKIENFINTFLFTKKVPQEIIDFYGKFEFSNYKEVANKLNKIYGG